MEAPLNLFNLNQIKKLEDKFLSNRLPNGMNSTIGPHKEKKVPLK